MKTVLITGCSSGFGRLLVPALLEKGYRVVATMRNLKERESLFDVEKEKFGDQLLIRSLDVTMGGERETVYQFCSSLTSLDATILNAGYGVFGPLEEVPESELRRQMEVNFFGVSSMIAEFLPLLRVSRGKIICVSSVAGFVGLPLGSPYAASKFALEGLIESLAYEVKPTGVQVCLVEPGRFRTSFSDNRKILGGGRRSAYFDIVQGFRGFWEQRRKEKGTPPDAVVQRIASLLTQKNLPLRVRCGRDAHLAYYLKRLLPSRLFRFAMETVIFKALKDHRHHASDTATSD